MGDDVFFTIDGSGPVFVTRTGVRATFSVAHRLPVYGVVLRSNASLRRQPSTDGAMLDVLPEGTLLQLLAERRAGDSVWLSVHRVREVTSEVAMHERSFARHEGWVLECDPEGPWVVHSDHGGRALYVDSDDLSHFAWSGPHDL